MIEQGQQNPSSLPAHPVLTAVTGEGRVVDRLEDWSSSTQIYSLLGSQARGHCLVGISLCKVVLADQLRNPDQPASGSLV